MANKLTSAACGCPLPIRTWFRVAAALVSILAVSVTAISVGLPHLALLQRAKTVLVRQLSDSLGFHVNYNPSK